MTKAKATPIGEVECPVKGCELIIPVFKYAATSTDPRFQRNAGKWYCRCPEHGPLGFAGAKGIQDHIADKGKIWGDQPKPAAQPAVETSNQPGKPEAGASTSTSQTSAASRTSSSTPPSRTSSSSSSSAAAPKPRMRLFGWDGRNRQ